MPRKPGRPSKYSAKLAAMICERLANGETLRRICREQDMPARSSVQKWLNEISEFSDQYAKARELQADYWADEILEIADDTSEDQSEDGKANNELVNRSRLRVDSRKWLLSKMVPKKYGDKLELGGAMTLRYEDALKELK